MLKSRKVDLSKGFQINGILYNVILVEELNCFDGDKCRCKCVHNFKCSSDSVSSFESFVEDSVLSEKLSNEEGEKGEGSRWWSEVTKGVGRGWVTGKTKKRPWKRMCRRLCGLLEKIYFFLHEKGIELIGSISGGDNCVSYSTNQCRMWGYTKHLGQPSRSGGVI